MSVRTNSSGDNLAVNATLGLGTGSTAFSFGGWFKLVTDRNTYVDFFSLCDAHADPTNYLSVDTDVDGTTLTVYSHVASDQTWSPALALSVGTWYYVVLGRSGTDFICRIFPDSSSTTPLLTASLNQGAADLTAWNWLVIGQIVGGGAPEWPDAEFAACRLHTGVYWTDSQCRAESQSYTPVTGGGTIFGNWKLQSTSADANGINDSSGAGHHLTNTGLVNGASTPTQLSSGGTVSAAGKGFGESRANGLLTPPKVLTVKQGAGPYFQVFRW